MLLREPSGLDWRAYDSKIVHKDLRRVFDVRQVTSKRRNLQVLLSLVDRLPANPTIESAQPISYYQLVFANLPVEANLTDQKYRGMLGDIDIDTDAALTP